MKKENKPVNLGSVLIGEKFVFRSVEIMGLEYSGHKPPYEGQELTIVGFTPKNKNNVVVRDPTGNQSLMPLDMVEKGLSLKKLRAN
jgi:hypothetical protein